VTASTSITNTSRNQKFRTSLSTNYSSTFTDMLIQDLTYKALTLAPNAPELYEKSGRINWKGYTPAYENPLAFLQRTFEATTNSLVANLVLTYSIVPSLNIRTNLGYTQSGYDAITTK